MISERNKTKLVRIIIIDVLICFSCIIIIRIVYKAHNNQISFISANHIDLNESNQIDLEQSFDKTQVSFETIDSNLLSSSFEQNNMVNLPLDPRATPEYIAAIERVPIHPWHTERVKNIRSETIEQLVENIANFDDALFAETSISEGYSPNQMGHQVRYIINLFRVRRLFEEGKKNPNEIIPILREAYKQAHESWPNARSDRLKEKAKGRLILKAPDEFKKVNTRAVATTYLLAELQDRESLKLLFDGYKKQRDWVNEYGEDIITSVPVPTPMTLYAIHRLAVTLPENKMDLQTLSLRNAYMEWADMFVSEPEILKVTAWNADYDESEAYRRFVDPEGNVLAGQLSIYMPRYPYQLKDGTFFFRGHFENEKQKEKEWADLLIPFVEATIRKN